MPDVISTGEAVAFWILGPLGLFLGGELAASLLVLAGSVWAIYVGTGIAWQLVRGGSRVGATASTFVVGSVGFAWASVAALFQDESHAHRGFALSDDLGRVLTRDVLIDRIWGPNYFGDTKTLDVHIKRLRAKLESDSASPTP